MRTDADTVWSDYLKSFHHEHPGITEDVLARAVSRHGLNPYQWITAPIPHGSRTLDVACGSGPCLRVRPHEPWIGLDSSVDELDRARAHGTSNVVLGNATSLPFDDATFDDVICSMAVMIIQPLAEALKEIRRVLRPGGMFVVTMPGRRKLRPRDVARYGRLVTRMGRCRLTYPNEEIMMRARSVFASTGFHVIDDVRLPFLFPIESRADSALLVRSLYLPTVDEPTLIRGERVAMRWVKSDIVIPLRRITLQSN